MHMYMNYFVTNIKYKNVLEDLATVTCPPVHSRQIWTV